MAHYGEAEVAGPRLPLPTLKRLSIAICYGDDSHHQIKIPIPDPHPKTCINFYQHILFPGKFVVIVQQSHIRKLRFKY